MFLKKTFKSHWSTYFSQWQCAFTLPFSLGAIHKGCPSRGGEGGLENQDKLGHRGGAGGGGFSNPDVRNLKNSKTNFFFPLF